MRTAVVALGKIGLPLAVHIASSGSHVAGIDINETVVDLVNKGVEPFPGEAELDSRLAAVVESGQLIATTSFAEGIADADVVIVVVPVVVDAEARPDFRAIDAATQAIGQNLKPGALVSYETTLPVHTTRHRFVPALEAASGRRSGVDFFVCHSPERVLTGRVFVDLCRYPKLVGGVDARSAELAVEFYETVLTFDERDDLDRPNGVWDLGTAEAAELAKLAETTYRNVNIAFANELALHASELGVDAQLVIAASNSQPYSHIHQPGIAVGGHCIPVYPKFYLSVDRSATLPAAAIAVNESMPRRAVDAIETVLGELRGRRVVVLGVAYRGGVKETAFSGALALRDVLSERGAVVLGHDPMFTDEELLGLGFEPFRLGGECDGLIVQADHDEYRRLSSADFPSVSAVFDGRRILDEANFAGIEVVAFGRPAMPSAPA